MFLEHLLFHLCYNCSSFVSKVILLRDTYQCRRLHWVRARIQGYIYTCSCHPCSYTYHWHTYQTSHTHCHLKVIKVQLSNTASIKFLLNIQSVLLSVFECKIISVVRKITYYDFSLLHKTWSYKKQEISLKLDKPHRLSVVWSSAKEENSAKNVQSCS